MLFGVLVARSERTEVPTRITHSQIKVGFGIRRLGQRDIERAGEDLSHLTVSPRR